MAHRTLKNAYSALADRLNRFPQGAPPSELLFRILSTLLREREAALVAQLPIRPFTVAKAARAWKLPLTEARTILDDLASRAILVDCEADGGEPTYVLPPPMAGFFEFSLMRVRDDIDQKALSELFHQYVTVEPDFMRELVAVGDTKVGRAFVNEPALPSDDNLEVLDFERASNVIDTATHIGVGMCYCRHKAEHVGKACKAPMNICMTFNTCASSLTKHGHARAVDRHEAHDLLAEAYEHNLVQFGENVKNRVSFICNCCGCCCEALIAQRRFAAAQPIATTNYLPVVSIDLCNGCAKCIDACPVEAMLLVSANDPARPRGRHAQVDEERCLGCGVCVRVCARGGVRLEARSERVITPYNNAHRVVLMAIERGTLQHLIFDNQVLASHRLLATLLGVILRLPPLKQVMASRQMKSRYLEAVIARSSAH